MDLHIIAIYCLCDDILVGVGYHDHPQAQMSEAEVMTAAIVAALFFSGNHARARLFLLHYRYMPNMLSKGRLNRRFRSLDPDLIQSVAACFGRLFHANNKTLEYIVDSFPVACCANCRIPRCRLVQEEKYRGYIASRKSYFYGIRVHMITTRSGEPVEFVFAPGSQSDIRILRDMYLDLPEGSYLYADKAYTDYAFEDLLGEFGIHYVAERRINSHRAWSGPIRFLHSRTRKRIETTFSEITRLFPRSIPAVTFLGFQLKVLFFLIGYIVSRYLKYNAFPS